MNNKLVLALVCLGFTASAKAEVNFDQGVDVESVIKDASAAENKASYPGQWGGDPFGQGPSSHHVSYSRDCHTFNFGADNAAVMSERVSLNSREWVEECHYVPDPPQSHPGQPGHHGGPGGGFDGPGGHNNGGHFDGPGGPGGHSGGPGGHHKTADVTLTKGMQCQQVPGQTFRTTAQLSIAQRKLFPWETESFEVCLDGPDMNINILRQAYTYSINAVGNYDVQYQLTPHNKVAMAPDRDGLSAGEFSSSDGRFVFRVNDRWAAEYAGEKVAVRVELYKDGFLFFDSYRGRKEFTFDSAQGYEINFAEKELDTSKSFDPNDDPSRTFTPGVEATRGSNKYFLKWSFRRIGQISTGGSVEKDKTDKLEVK